MAKIIVIFCEGDDDLPSSPRRTMSFSTARLVFVALIVTAVVTAIGYAVARQTAAHWIESGAPTAREISAEIEARLVKREDQWRDQNAEILHDQILRLRAGLADLHGRGSALAKRLGLSDMFADPPALECLADEPVVEAPPPDSDTPSARVSDAPLSSVIPASRDPDLRLEKAAYATLSRRYHAMLEYGAAAAVSFDTVPMARPVIGRNWQTSRFGYRRDPFTGRRAFHTGYDYAAARGTPVVAAATGIVIYAGRLGNYGKAIRISHGDGVSTLYAHLHAIDATSGQYVRRGEVIGKVGNTGRSTGPHLHYEVRVDNRPRPVNSAIKKLRTARGVPAEWDS